MPDPKPCRITVSFFPPTEERPRGYLGATSSYDPLPGEDWRRGDDLADGPAAEETLALIVDDIRAVMEGFPRAYERDHPTES